MEPLHPILLDPIIAAALTEDWGYGDWTTDLCVPVDKKSAAVIITREDIVVSGIDVAAAVFRKVDASLKIEILAANGSSKTANDPLLRVAGSARSILKAERVALNFLGRMCGIATTTRSFVDQLAGTSCKLLDTRKTTPGLRLLEKIATSTGGGQNHRVGLCDGIMIKENHIRAAGGIATAIQKVKEARQPTLKIEVEVTSIPELEEAISAGADIIMLDNMALEDMKVAVGIARSRGHVLLEASGGVKLGTVRNIAETGVDFISTGATIHSSKWADLSLLFDV